MVLVEIIAIVGVAGIMSACAVWGCPSLKNQDFPDMSMMIFTQGQCGRVLLPSQKDQERMRSVNNSNREENLKKD